MRKYHAWVLVALACNAKNTEVTPTAARAAGCTLTTAGGTSILARVTCATAGKLAKAGSTSAVYRSFGVLWQCALVTWSRRRREVKKENEDDGLGSTELVGTSRTTLGVLGVSWSLSPKLAYAYRPMDH